MIALTPFQYAELAVVAAGYAIALALLPRVIVARRESAATLSWILALLFIPYVGILFYWLFGEARLQRTARRRRSARAAVASALSDDRARRSASTTSVRAEDADFIRLATRVSGVEPLGGNALDLYTDADLASETMLEAIDGARKSIHFLVYQFKADETGSLFRDRLAAAAARGVKVRLLVDDVGSFWTTRRFFRALEQAGGSTARFLPVNPLRGLYHANLRNHRKILIVDGKVGFLGGLNVGDEYGGLRKRRFGPWRDTHVRLRGPAVASLHDTFLEDWFFAAREELDPAEWCEVQECAGEEYVQIISSGPDCDWEAIHHTIFSTVTRAKDHCFLTTPYFVPDRSLLVALQTAALRGVDVRVLMPARSDHLFVRSAGRYHYDELLRAGVRIFEYQEGMLHAKTLEVDDRFATIGSANLDLRSFRLNFEVNVAAYGSHVAEELHRTFLSDLEKSKEITRAVTARWRYGRRFVHALARLMEGLL